MTKQGILLSHEQSLYVKLRVVCVVGVWVGRGGGWVGVVCVGGVGCVGGVWVVCVSI